MKLSSDDVIFSLFQMTDESLYINFSTLAGENKHWIEFKIKAQFLANVFKRKAFYEGEVLIDLIDSETETLNFGCIYQ
jgi:hypothetical protein